MEQTYQVFQYEIPILLTKDFSKLGVITSNISTETYIEEIYSVFSKKYQVIEVKELFIKEVKCGLCHKSREPAMFRTDKKRPNQFSNDKRHK